MRYEQRPAVSEARRPGPPARASRVGGRRRGIRRRPVAVEPGAPPEPATPQAPWPPADAPPPPARALTFAQHELAQQPPMGGGLRLRGRARALGETAGSTAVRDRCLPALRGGGARDRLGARRREHSRHSVWGRGRAPRSRSGPAGAIRRRGHRAGDARADRARRLPTWPRTGRGRGGRRRGAPVRGRRVPALPDLHRPSLLPSPTPRGDRASPAVLRAAGGSSAAGSPAIPASYSSRRVTSAAPPG